jgi:hypothetical protein
MPLEPPACGAKLRAFLAVPLPADRRISQAAWPFLEVDVLGLNVLTFRRSQVPHVVRLSGNFSIAKAQRAVQGVFEVKTFSIRPIRSSCSGFTAGKVTEGIGKFTTKL